MPAALRATWGASRIELTRASTAIDAGSTPGSPSQPSHDLDDRFGAAVRFVLDDAQRPRGGVVERTGDDLLGDAPLVVAEQRRRRGDDLRRAAVVDAQGVLTGTGEQGAVVDEERRVGPGVPVDALVVVADAEHVESRQAEQADQQDVGRREILELVDEHVPAAPLHLGAERAVGEDRLDGGVDLLVEVDDATVAERAAESWEQLAEAVDVVAGALDLVGVAQPEADRRQTFQVGADRVDVRPSAPVPRQQRVDELAHLALVDDRRLAATVLAEHPQTERVERADVRSERLRARRQLALGLLVVGDGEHRRGVVAAVDDEVAQPLRQHAGLARSGRGDDPCRPALRGQPRAVGRRRARRRAVPAQARTAGRPASTDSAWITAPIAAGSQGWRGPPSIHASVPSASSRSPACVDGPSPTSSTTALPGSNRLALRAHHHTGAASPRQS